MKMPVLLIILTLFGCAPTVYKYNYQFRGGHYIQGVPSFSLEDYYCGPSAVASVLNYLGKKVRPGEVARGIHTPKVKGTITADLVNYARKAGFKADSYKGSIENIQAEISKVRPLIIFVDIGNQYFPKERYIIVVGYNKEGIVAHSGKDKDVFMPYENLLKIWGKTGYEALLILPKEGVAP